MYTNRVFSIKIVTKKTEPYFQGRAGRQDSNLTLYNINISELAKQLENPHASGLELQDNEIKCLRDADDLVLLFPTNG